MKWLDNDRQPQEITVTSLVHIPELEGYWAQGLEVLDLCLQSLRKNTEYPFDLMLLDNGSCLEVQEYLQLAYQEGKIQYLIFSKYNLRKLRALDFLMAVAPGEIISYTDSDVFFLPGWLETSMAVLDAYPEAGQVTALPTIDRQNKYCAATKRGVLQNDSLIIEQGDLVPPEYVKAHAVSLGITLEHYQNRLQKREDIRIIRNGIGAYVSAQDFQFTTKREVLDKILPLQLINPEIYYDPVYSPVFEAKLDEQGFWRLASERYLAHHMGNVVPDFSDELAWVRDLSIFDVSIPMQMSSFDKANTVTGHHRLLQHPRVRRNLKRVNALTYRLLYE